LHQAVKKLRDRESTAKSTLEALEQKHVVLSNTNADLKDQVERMQDGEKKMMESMKRMGDLNDIQGRRITELETAIQTLQDKNASLQVTF
jgi:hypothetical protein